ncbi:cyanidin-3-O-glucoside 2-O-glucuronosyltransferase-like [Rutidosis leptorrhynchoides]|uniref:cyanidin-3-O-glucoside 2-O-glucuronosyltransferase-like n=1 Tax=Rutidosis leptorrhynchoides TaxID=125765 RepID=UPI003A99C418
MDSRDKSIKFHVVMLPWLAYSHISRFLAFAKRLTNHNFKIYLCSSQINFEYIKNNLEDKYSKSIEFVELNLPSSSDLPLHYHTTNGLPPHLKQTLTLDYEKCAPGFTTILENLRPHLVIYDFNQWWAADAASSLNIPTVEFVSGCAAMYSMVAHYSIKPLGEKFPFPEIYLKDHEIAHGKEVQGYFPVDNTNVTQGYAKTMKKSCEIVLVKSLWELEKKYIDYKNKVLGKKVLPAGPLIQESSLEVIDEHMEIFRWLDKKEESSVVFVSFGSEYLLSDNEIEDITHGLELSQVSFIWVIRFPKGIETSVEEVLPHGFLERLGERGLVIKNWAPQAKILSHLSTGGFVSHCGWGSCMESLRYGVPIIAMPMQFDQPYNARILESVGVGIDVGRGGDGRLKREEMAEMLRKVVVEDVGVNMKKKAMEMCVIVKKNMDDEVDKEIIESLVKLCEK